MLNENIKRARKAKGLSQEELAVKLNVVRQTVSKWENGLSVPDSDLLIFLAEELDTSVSALLGETIQEQEPDDLKTISEKLEIINLQLAKRTMARTKVIRWGLLSLCALIVIVYVVLAAMKSSYLGWITVILNWRLRERFYMVSSLSFKACPHCAACLRGWSHVDMEEAVMKKIVITVLAVVAVLAIAVIFAFHRTDQPSEINENEIALQIQLDLKEDVGLLIIDSDIDGQKESGGISNADKTMLKKDDLIYWSIDKQHYETVSDMVELLLNFTVITEYATQTMRTFILKNIRCR